ncbi:MAG TPA: hypothetical protein VHE77_17150 [Dongiaceae bacterium]|jgi:hypothetical protein|nr:hypothetical protein [Dongiaceae bacterium]
MLSMFGRGDGEEPTLAKRNPSLKPANTNGPTLRSPGTELAAARGATGAAKRAQMLANAPTTGQYLYHLAADIRAFTRSEISGAVVGATPAEVQRLARLAAKLKGRYLAQALDLTAADHGPIAETDIRFLERSRFMYEEVERALSALRHAVETGDLALEGLRRD